MDPVGHPDPAPPDRELAEARDGAGSAGSLGVRCQWWVRRRCSDDVGRPGWVFPFDKPLAPEDGDNQALAVNTTDGTVEYDVAVALVWQTDEEYALNVNEAHAYASCSSCAAVAVAYQVVFVIDEDDANDNVAVPQNPAGALNYDCVNCLTYAVAQQLFVTLDDPLSEEARAEIDEVWRQVGIYAALVESGGACRT